MKLPMLFLLAPGLLTLAVGCVPPNTKVELGQLPDRASTPELDSAQERVVPLGLDQALAKSLDALLDMGFQVRSANPGSGQVNIYRSWRDPSGSVLSVEATLLFRPVDPTSTKIRMLASGNWQFISIGGPKSANADVSGLSNVNDPAGYRAFLDKLAAALSH